MLQQITSVAEWNMCLNILLDPDVSEIESNAPDQFFMKKKGKRILIEGLKVDSKEAYMNGIKEGLVPHVDSPWPFRENSYLYEGPLRYEVDEKLVRGRCHIVLPPACDYPQVTIAKKSTTLPDLGSIAERGSMSTEMLLFVMKAVEADLTMVISGGTGAGKTTMLEAMTKLFSHGSRIGVAEDAPELYLEQPNVSYLHSVPWQPGMNPNDVANLSWVVQQYQRMRTDKLIIGETRGQEFADFLVAANSGMDGSLTTIHANDPATALDKMTNFALKASHSPVRTINTDIANSIDIIIQLRILADGRHRVSAIREITRTLGNGEDAKISTNKLYEYEVATDSWSKVNPMGDQLRDRFQAKAVDIQPFFIHPVGSKLTAHPGVHALEALIGGAPALEPTNTIPEFARPRTGGLPRTL